VKKKLIGIAAAFIMTTGFLGCANDTADQSVFNIRAGYVAGPLTLATAYESLPRCTETTSKGCSDPKVVEQLRKADLAAKSALDNAEFFVRNHGDLEAKDAIEAARSAIASMSKIITIYNIKIGG
jgi:hypothetical protein